MLRSLTVLLCFASPVRADVNDYADTFVGRGYALLATSAQMLSDGARADCSPDALKPIFFSTYDAWIAVSHFQFGPVEDRNLALAMTFWPDPKDRVGKAITRLSVAQDPVVDDPDLFAEVSVAAQGFTALERVLFDPQSGPDYACRLIQAIAAEIARNSALIHADWAEFSELMRTAGAPENTRFQSTDEVTRALYTSLSVGLEFLHHQRLGRPLGTFERPRPRRAEARRSGRAQQHVELSLIALNILSIHLGGGDAPRTYAAFEDALDRVRALDDPAFAGVAEPQARLRLESLQRSVRDIQEAAEDEIGARLGISAGFNALDGD
jgi:predicted lipoprotein